MEPRVMKTYYVIVRDPETLRCCTFTIRNMSKLGADAAARMGWTGLLGGPHLTEIRERLEVDVTEVT